MTPELIFRASQIIRPDGVNCRKRRRGRRQDLHEAGIFGFKCFLLDFGLSDFSPLSSEQLKAAMAEIASFDGLLIVHAEDPDVILANPCPPTTRYADFVSSRPTLAETRAIETVIDAARSAGCRAHIVHLSSADAVPALAAARQEGVRLTVATCPHYLALSAEDVANGATQFKSCPPVRDAANRDRLWQALADGVIDFVVSDHSPQPAGAEATGQRRLRRRLGRYFVAATRAASGLDGSAKPRPQPVGGGSVDVHLSGGFNWHSR